MYKNIFDENKYLFLFFIYSAIIFYGAFFPSGESGASVNGDLSSFLFRAVETRHITAEVYLLSNVRCGIENASKPLDYSARLNPVWKNLKVDAGALEDVYLIVEPLAFYGPLKNICTHNCLWFEFSKDHPAAGDDGFKTYGIVCSGQMLKNLKGEFFLFQFTSKEDYFELAYYTDRNLRLYKLELNADQKKRLFYNAIVTASERAAKERYHIIYNHCVNNMFELINTVLPSYQRFNPWLVHGIIFNPVFCAPDFNELIFNFHGLIKEKLPIFRGAY